MKPTVFTTVMGQERQVKIMGKKNHVILDPKRDSRYKRRHPEDAELVPKRSKIQRERNSFLDKRFASK